MTDIMSISRERDDGGGEEVTKKEKMRTKESGCT